MYIFLYLIYNGVSRRNCYRTAAGIVSAVLILIYYRTAAAVFQVTPPGSEPDQQHRQPDQLQPDQDQQQQHQQQHRQQPRPDQDRKNAARIK